RARGRRLPQRPADSLGRSTQSGAERLAWASAADRDPLTSIAGDPNAWHQRFSILTSGQYGVGVVAGNGGTDKPDPGGADRAGDAGARDSGRMPAPDRHTARVDCSEI